MTDTLADALSREIARVTTMLSGPDDLPEEGIPMLAYTIGAAQSAIESGDVFAMVNLYAVLKGYSDDN